jgi:hypothetical protein
MPDDRHTVVNLDQAVDRLVTRMLERFDDLEEEVIEGTDERAETEPSRRRRPRLGGAPPAPPAIF